MGLEEHNDNDYMLAGVRAEICAVSADDDDIKILIGRRHRKANLRASQYLMPYEFTDTRTKDQLKEQKDAACGKDFVHVKVPQG